VRQIVVLTINRPYNAPGSIGLDPATNLSEAEALLVRRHLSELEIVNRYHRFFRSEYLHLLRIVNLLRRTEQNVKESLHIFCELERIRSLNGWKHLFYSGVLANQDLVEYLILGQLPEV